MTGRSHIRFFVVGNDDDLFWWNLEHPHAVAIHVPLDAPAAALARTVVNPWDQVVHLDGWYRLPIPARAGVWQCVQSARSAGRRLTPAERRAGAA